MSIRENLEEIHGEGLVFLDPPEEFDGCIVGVAERCGMEPVVVYDEKKVIDSLVARGLEREEAEEFFDFNIAGAYVGERTPMLITMA